MYIPKHLHNLTNAQRAEIIENWTYLLIGARADLRILPEHHGNRLYAEAQVKQCEAKIVYFKALPTVEDRATSRQRQREQAKRVMDRAHAIYKQATNVWGAVDFGSCLKAAWQEEKTGKAFQIIREPRNRHEPGDVMERMWWRQRGFKDNDRPPEEWSCEDCDGTGVEESEVSLQEALEALKISENLRKVAEIYDRIEAMSCHVNVASCLANGIIPD